MVLAPFVPCAIVREEGEAPMVKFGVAAAFTVKAIVVV